MKPIGQATRAGHDRWLVSYADLVTLLFAFFTTLYAASMVRVSAETSTLPKPGVSAAGVTLHATAKVKEGAANPIVETLRDTLSTKLADDVRARRADIMWDGRGIVISLPERATFAIGSAELTDDTRALIAKVIAALGEERYALRIEGHTDDVPIQTAQYRSNWELSTARAGAVVAFLIGERHLAPQRLSAAGYAEFHPMVPNDSAVNRARNRRIDIVVLQDAEAVNEGTE